MKLGKFDLGDVQKTTLPYTGKDIEFYIIGKVNLTGNSWKKQSIPERLKRKFTHYEVLVERGAEGGKRVFEHDYLPKDWVDGQLILNTG